MLGYAGRAENTVSVAWRFLLRLVMVGLALYACYRLRNIITTIFIAAIIAYTLNPLVDWLCRQQSFARLHEVITRAGAQLQIGYRRSFHHQLVTPEGRVRIHRHVLRVYATLYVFVFTVFALWWGIRLIVTPFVSEIKIATSPAKIQEITDKVNDRLDEYDADAPDWRSSDKIREQVKKIDLSKIAQGLFAELGQKALESAKNIVEVVVLPVLAFYFLIDGRKLKHEFIALMPRRHLRETMRIVNEFNRIMRDFVVGQVILCALAGVVVGVGLAALHVQYPFVMGVLAGITRAIPIIGPIIGGIPIVILTLVSKGPATALGVLGFFTLLHLVESKFIMPKLIGDRMELHPVIIIVVLIAGGEIGGVLIGGTIGSLLGMFFAAPIASIVRIMIRRYWLGLRRAADHPFLDSDALQPALPGLPRTETFVEAVPAGESRK